MESQHPAQAASVVAFPAARPRPAVNLRAGTDQQAVLDTVLDTPEQRRRTSEELVDALVEIHNVDWEACGLEGDERMDIAARQMAIEPRDGVAAPAAVNFFA